MGCKQNEIPFEDAKTKVSKYPYALVNMMSEMCLGMTSDIDILWEELLEARFFSEKEELHVFRCEKNWMAVIITDDENSGDTLLKSYLIAPRFQNAGKELMVKEYLAYDDDGQVYVEQTRLCGIAEGRTNGQ